ncbi:MAG: hypothetical protein H6550_12190 [Chitinophagales bacterium]|nr:hypothetical protein [Chitinophagales bacterium]
MAQTLDNELRMFIDQLNSEQKESLLSIIKAFFKKNRTSVEQYNIEIDAAMMRMQAGEYISQRDVEKDAEQW